MTNFSSPFLHSVIADFFFLTKTTEWPIQKLYFQLWKNSNAYNRYSSSWLYNYGQLQLLDISLHTCTNHRSFRWEGLTWFRTDLGGCTYITPSSSSELISLMLAQNRLAVCITDTHATHAQLMAIWFPLPIRINTNTTWPFINSLAASSYSKFTEGYLSWL